MGNSTVGFGDIKLYYTFSFACYDAQNKPRALMFASLQCIPGSICLKRQLYTKPQAKNVPYQPLLIKPIFLVFVEKSKKGKKRNTRREKGSLFTACFLKASEAPTRKTKRNQFKVK